jgi:hypothetical protein
MEFAQNQKIKDKNDIFHERKDLETMAFCNELCTDIK